MVPSNVGATKHTSQNDSLFQYDLGKAFIQPNGPIVAGSFTTIQFTYTCGHPIDDSGYIKITFGSTSDAGAPQLDDPGAPNFTTVATTGNCRIEARWDPKGHIRPWSRALFLKIRGGYLDRGEQIAVTFGATAEGSPGWQMQTNCVEKFEFKTFVDPIATYQFKELPASPNFSQFFLEKISYTIFRHTAAGSNFSLLIDIDVIIKSQTISPKAMESRL